MKKTIGWLCALLLLAGVAWALDPLKKVTFTPDGGVREPYEGTNTAEGPPQKWDFGGTPVTQTPNSAGTGWLPNSFKSAPPAGQAFPYYEYQFDVPTEGHYTVLRHRPWPNLPIIWETGTYTQQ